GPTRTFGGDPTSTFQCGVRGYRIGRWRRSSASCARGVAGMTFRFAAEAISEFIAAGQYYNQRVAGLGDDFVNEVETGITAICESPYVWRMVQDDVRRFLIPRFPYGIY